MLPLGITDFEDSFQNDTDDEFEKPFEDPIKKPDQPKISTFAGEKKKMGRCILF